MMFQISFLAIGLSALALAIAYIFKRYQRAILWTVALILFIGTALSLGFGLVKIVENGVVNQIAVYTIVLSFICSAIFACNAEKVHVAMQKKNSVLKVSSESQIEENSEEDSDQADNDGVNEDKEKVQLPPRLDTGVARDIFSKAIEAGLMEENGDHYKWKQSKVLLAYMCGRIYCEDRPKYDRIENKTFWKFGRTEFFPESDLNELFEVTDLAQSRQNRKDSPVPQGSDKIDELF